MIEQIEAIAAVDPARVQAILGERKLADCLEEFDEQGYIIFERLLDEEKVKAFRRALQPWLEKQQAGRNAFEGYRTQRIYALLAKDPLFAEMAAHPLALAFAEAELGVSCLLSAMLAIQLQPGESEQPWHYDDGNIQIPLPRPSFGVSAFWALDDTTEENGATELLPGSHRQDHDALSSETMAYYRAGSEKDSQDSFSRDDAIKAVMPAGSLMLAKGTLLHRGGANRSDKPRLIITPQYCPGWARQLENQFLAVPAEKAAQLPARVQALLGYSLHGTFMGYVDGRHPKRLLET